MDSDPDHRPKDCDYATDAADESATRQPHNSAVLLVWSALLIGFNPMVWGPLLVPLNEPPRYRWSYGVLTVMAMFRAVWSPPPVSWVLFILAVLMLLSGVLFPSIAR